ncbi:hypothetical protein OSTOST_15794 [Ostertagia ostertagi]
MRNFSILIDFSVARSLGRENHTNDPDQFCLCHKMRTAAVQQGLVHKDPDVDAIFSSLSLPLHRIIVSGTYAPWNSQNTLFHKKAFFMLFLPTTVTFVYDSEAIVLSAKPPNQHLSTTDIWRSYIAQKLLHMIGETVAFYPPNAVQYRNAHDYLADFEDESFVGVLDTITKGEQRSMAK